MPIDPMMYITLQELLIFAQSEKEKLLRGGRGLPESIPEDPPLLENYFLPEDPPAVEHTGRPSLMDRITANKRKKESEQISVDEAIESANNVENVKQSSTSTAPPPAQTEPDTMRITANQRIREYFDSLNAWRIEKNRKKLEYVYLKQEVADKCYGFDTMIDKINRLIKELKAMPEAKPADVDYQTVNEDNKLI